MLKSAITGDAAPSAPSQPAQTMPLSSGEEEPDWLKDALGKSSAPAAPAPATRPAAAAAPRYAPAGGGYDMVDKVLAITAAVVALVALIRVVTL